MACNTCGVIRADLARAIKAKDVQGASQALRTGVKTMAQQAADKLLHKRPAVSARKR
jgi:hypothetical protein